MTATRTNRRASNHDALLERAGQVLAPTYERPAMILQDGEGASITASDGRRYLDMTGGIAVSALGHGDDGLTGAIREAADAPLHVSNLYHSRPAIELATELVASSFADQVFFTNSGAEAVEAALKFARLHGHNERHEIVSFDGAFHGRTFGALAATDRLDYQVPFRPLPGGFRRASFGSPEGITAIDENTAAVIVEPIQGESGVRMAPAGWLRELRARCDETGALLIFDEVQCGVGRTGALWAHEHAGVEPDLMTTAKGLGGGLPIGAVLMRAHVASDLYPGCHGTTFGGGPFVTAVALHVLRRVRDTAFLAHVGEMGAHLVARLRALGAPAVEEIRGKGLMVGVQMRVDVGDVVGAALREGLLVVPAGNNTVRFLPALTVTEDDVDEAVRRFGVALGGLPSTGRADT